MIAAKDVSARHNGREYAFKKGERLDCPPALLRAMAACGAAREERKEGPHDQR